MGRRPDVKTLSVEAQHLIGDCVMVRASALFVQKFVLL